MRPVTITLCGSMKFEKYFKVWNEALSLAGHVVFTTAVYPSFKEGIKEWYSKEQKEILDEVHVAKIRRSDAILLLNVHAYVGESTLREVQNATAMGKKLYALESWAVGNGICEMHYDSIQKDVVALGIKFPYRSPIDTRGDERKGFENPMWSDLFGRAGKQRSALIDLVKSVEPLCN